MHEGTVIYINQRGFGFIRSGGEDVFFHCSRIAPDLPFDEQLVELRVKFDRIETPKGVEARNVQAAI